MAIRQEIQELIVMGPFPDEHRSDIKTIKMYEELPQSIHTPITDEEAKVLLDLFGSDSCFGLAWTLVYIIETAPGWPLNDVLNNAEDVWSKILIQRSKVNNVRR